MKKILYIITAVSSVLLTLLIILLGLYMSNPTFKSKVDGLTDRGTPGAQATSNTETPGSFATNGGQFTPGSAEFTQGIPSGQTSSDSGYGTDGIGDSALQSGGMTSDGYYDPNLDTSDPTDYLAPDADSGYTPPAAGFLDIPEEVSGKTGSEDDISADLTTLPDEEADRLEDELSEGNTGDGLDFDPLMYPYYHMLDDASKHLYRQIYANAMDRFDDFKAVEPAANPAQLKNAYIAVISDHPELFHIDTKYSAAYRNNGKCLEIRLYFNDLAGNYDSANADFQNAAAALKNNAPSDPYEFEKSVHATLAGMDVYTLGAPYNQTAYSALNTGRTVCAGYSRAFQYVCQLAGIPCYYCSGYAGESHAWNIICLDGDYYNVDLTWDDTDSSAGFSYDWFNKTDADYGTTHIRKELSVYLPPCNGTKYRNLESNPAGDSSADSSDPSQSGAPTQEGAAAPTGSLADYGLSEEDVVYDLQSYYDKCRDKIASLGAGSHSFDIPVNDMELMLQIRDAYNSGSADTDLFRPALEAAGAMNINTGVYPVQLADGRFVLRHNISMK